MICIVPAPGCGDTLCLPRACGTNDACPEGSACFPYDMKTSGSKVKTCVRIPADPPYADGTLGGKCLPDGSCVSPLHFCRDACSLGGMMCIVPVETCLPWVCDPAAPNCPIGSTCDDVGITTACVKKG
jgi:hypothetical protein